MPKRPKSGSAVRLIHLNPKKRSKSGIFSGNQILGTGMQGTVHRVHYNGRKSFAEKVYHSPELQSHYRVYHATNARRDFRTFFWLKKFIPAKYFPPTIRLKVERGKPPTLILSDLTENGRFQLVDAVYANSSVVRNESLKISLDSQKNSGPSIPPDALLVQFDPKTRQYGRLFIVDVGNVAMEIVRGTWKYNRMFKDVKARPNKA